MYEGKLVRLRAFEPEDLQAEHMFVNDYETARGMRNGILFPSSLEDDRQWLSGQSSYTRGEYQFAIDDMEGNHVGRCGVISLSWKDRVAELAIMIGAPFRGRGYGREAMAMLCDFCFREMNLRRLKVKVFAFHQAALRCYEGNGFEREGVLRGEVYRDGAYQDVILLAKMRPDCAG